MEDRTQTYEAYLRGELSESERQALEQTWADPAEKADFDTYQAARAAITHRRAIQEKEDSLRNELQPLNKRFFASAKRRSLWQRNSGWLKAAAIAVLVLSTFIVIQSNRFDDQRLLRLAMDERPLSVTRGAEGLFTYPEAMMAYEQEQWAAAAEALELIPSDDSVYSEAQLHAGYAWLHIAEYERAAAALSRALPRTSSPEQRSNVQWHLALAELGVSKDITALQPILDKTEHPHYEQALALRKKWDSIWR